MVDQVIVMEESKSSDPADPRYNNMIFSDRDRFKRMLLASMQSFLLLIVFPAVQMFSDSGRKFMAEYYDAMVVLLLAIVLFSQAILLVITLYRPHPVNGSIFAILYLLGLSSIASILEVGLVSSTAAVITFSICGITITIVVMANWQEISSIFSGRIKKFMELLVLPGVWVILVVGTIFFILIKFICNNSDCST